MHLANEVRKALRRIALGDTDLPQQCTVALQDPQTEVRVWLHGLGMPRDITERHTVACASPLTIGIGSESSSLQNLNSRLCLHFREHGGEERLLGEIGLRPLKVIPTGGPELHLFSVRNCRNYCLPKMRIWAHNLYQAYVRNRDHRDHTLDIPIAAREIHSMAVLFICPRPVALVTATHEDRGNMFPMNLMGSIGNGYFAFALNSTRPASHLVERAGRIALSTIPLEHAELARQLGRNHKLEYSNWNELPFPTKLSPVLHIPVPCFTLRVREMEIEATQKLGSHTLFVAHIIRDESFANGLQFFMVHGTYQARRQRNGCQAPGRISVQHGEPG